MFSKKNRPDLEAVRRRRVDSLADEAQEVSTDVPEDSVTHDQQDVDLKKVRPNRWKSSFGNTCRNDS